MNLLFLSYFVISRKNSFYRLGKKRFSREHFRTNNNIVYLHSVTHFSDNSTILSRWLKCFQMFVFKAEFVRILLNKHCVLSHSHFCGQMYIIPLCQTLRQPVDCIILHALPPSSPSLILSLSLGHTLGLVLVYIL